MPLSVAALLTVAVGGLAALDATAVAQSLFSAPLVTATVLGWIWGNWEVALQVGIVLQVLAASTMPVGARTPEDYSSGGVVGAGVALALARQLPFEMTQDACCLLGVLAGLLTATFGVRWLKWQRRRNEGLSRWCEAELRAGRDGALTTAHGAAVALAFGVGVAWTALMLLLFVWALAPLANHESLRLARAWGLAQPLWVGLGLAALLNGFLQRRLARAAVFGAALIAAWLALVLAGR